jgi:hypothetical protein
MAMLPLIISRDCSETRKGIIINGSCNYSGLVPHDQPGKVSPKVAAPVQYGPNVQALAVYLHQGQLLLVARTCQVLTDICGCYLCEGTVLPWVERAGERLAPTVERIADLIASSPLQHGDETSIRVYAMLFWLYVNCTRWLTHLSWHPARHRSHGRDRHLAAFYRARRT